MRPIILVCMLVFAVAMEGVRVGAHWIVGTFGLIGTLTTIGVIYFGACVWERREQRNKIEIFTPNGDAPR